MINYKKTGIEVYYKTLRNYYIPYKNISSLYINREKNIFTITILSTLDESGKSEWYSLPIASEDEPKVWEEYKKLRDVLDNYLSFQRL